MESGLLKLNMANVYSALVYGFIMLGFYVISQGSVFGLDWRALVDVTVMGIIGSLIKNLGTTNDGNFLGVIPVIPETKK